MLSPRERTALKGISMETNKPIELLSLLLYDKTANQQEILEKIHG